MMNILYDHQTFSLQQHGGISRYFSEIIPRIAKTPECDVSVFMGYHVNEYGLENSRSLYRQFRGHKIPYLPHTMTIRLALNEFLLNRFARQVGDGIYHQTYFYDVLRGWRGKRVVTVYDMIYERFPGDYDRDDPTAANKAKVVRESDFVICISESTRRDLINILDVPEEKTGVVYLANSLNIDAPAVPTQREPYILFVGKRGGYKNFDILLDAYIDSPFLKMNFSLICFGGGEFTAEERNLISRNELSTKVSAIGGPDEVLAGLYASASAFVYPSLYEGFGIPPLEAMHYGCPVVASKSSSMPEVVGDAGLYFDASLHEDLRNKLETLLQDHELKTRLTTLGYEREKCFSWTRCALETLAIYKKLS